MNKIIEWLHYHLDTFFFYSDDRLDDLLSVCEPKLEHIPSHGIVKKMVVNNSKFYAVEISIAGLGHLHVAITDNYNKTCVEYTAPLPQSISTSLTNALFRYRTREFMVDAGEFKKALDSVIGYIEAGAYSAAIRAY